MNDSRPTPPSASDTRWPAEALLAAAVMEGGEAAAVLEACDVVALDEAEDDVLGCGCELDEGAVSLAVIPSVDGVLTGGDEWLISPTMPGLLVDAVVAVVVGVAAVGGCVSGCTFVGVGC